MDQLSLQGGGSAVQPARCVLCAASPASRQLAPAGGPHQACLPPLRPPLQRRHARRALSHPPRRLLLWPARRAGGVGLAARGSPVARPVCRHPGSCRRGRTAARAAPVPAARLSSGAAYARRRPASAVGAAVGLVGVMIQDSTALCSAAQYCRRLHRATAAAARAGRHDLSRGVGCLPLWPPSVPRLADFHMCEPPPPPPPACAAGAPAPAWQLAWRSSRRRWRSTSPCGTAWTTWMRTRG